MNLAVLGATGGTGEAVLRRALAAGHRVTALVRRPEAVAISDGMLNVMRGNVLDPEDIVAAARKADALISALGARELARPTRLYSQAATAAIVALNRLRLRRFIAISAVPAGPDSQKSVFERRVLHPLLYRFFGGGYEDMRRMESVLAQSDLDWTVFRPPMLTNRPGSGRYRIAVGVRLPHAFSIARGDLADAMLKSIGNSRTFGRVVTVAT